MGFRRKHMLFENFLEPANRYTCVNIGQSTHDVNANGHLGDISVERERQQNATLRMPEREAAELETVDDWVARMATLIHLTRKSDKVGTP